MESLLGNKQITSASRLKALSKVGTTVMKIQGSFEGDTSQYSDGENRRGSRSGRTLRGSSSSAGRPRHESSIAKNYLQSSSIEKNCLRSSSTRTGGVHRDKESLPNAKVQKPNWNTSARAHDATAEFPQIQARGSELKGECDESGHIIIHRKFFPFQRVADPHFGATVLSQVHLNTFEFVVHLARMQEAQCCVVFGVLRTRGNEPPPMYRASHPHGRGRQIIKTILVYTSAD